MNREIGIPGKSRGEVRWLAFFTVFLLFWVGFALVDLVRGEAIVPSLLWLALVVYGLLDAVRSEGGWLRVGIKTFGILFGKEFAEIGPTEGAPSELRFGFVIFKQRHVWRKFPLARVEKVDWMLGQASAMSGRDRNDWLLWLRLKKEGPLEASGRGHSVWLHLLGSDLKKADAERDALSFVQFLQDAGVPMVKGSTETEFVRSEKEPGLSDTA